MIIHHDRDSVYTGKVWVRRHLIDDAPREYPVIHDEGDPSANRLVHPEDFLV